MNPVRKIEQIRVADIDVPKDRRPIDEAALKPLIESMRRIGLRTPITVRYRDDRPSVAAGTDDSHALVTGRHRLAAAKALGWEKIDCFVVDDGDDSDDQFWEIAENLHRADLTALQRDEQVAKWIALTDAKAKQPEALLGSREVLRQVDAKPSQSIGGRPEGGIRAAARELNVSEPAARRAVKVASLSPEAKQAARDAGLDDNRSAMLEAAKYTETEQQVQALKRRPVDRLKIAAKNRSRMLREIAAIIVQHIPADVLPALRVNLDSYGQPQIAEAIVKASKELRR